MHSRFSGYSSLLSDMSCSSTASMGSSSRWDSQASSESANKEKKVQQPKMPARRMDSNSPPASPAAEPRSTRRCKSSPSSRKRPSAGFANEVDEADCLRRSPPVSSPEKPISLADAATNSVLRMPQRQASASERSRRSDKQGLPRRHGKITEGPSKKNVSTILGEVIRELGIEEESAELKQ